LPDLESIIGPSGEFLRKGWFVHLSAWQRLEFFGRFTKGRLHRIISEFIPHPDYLSQHIPLEVDVAKFGISFSLALLAAIFPLLKTLPARGASLAVVTRSAICLSVCSFLTAILEWNFQLRDLRNGALLIVQGNEGFFWHLGSAKSHAEVAWIVASIGIVSLTIGALLAPIVESFSNNAQPSTE
jgi:hypothetical protein